MRNSFLIILVFLFLFVNVATSAEKKNISCKNCNLIIISLTSTRKANMSAFGYNRKTTPNIDSFFANSFFFNNAFAPASLTFTDAISLFYSLSPNIHKAFIRKQKQRMSGFLQKYNSLTDILASNGYKTAAFVSDEDYEYSWGIGRTFKYYFDRSYYAENGIVFRPFTYSVGTKNLVPLATKWLETNHKNKFFLFLQGYDMHCPFSPMGNFEKMFEMPHSADIPFTKECFMTKRGPEFEMVKGERKQVLKSFFSYLKKKEVKYYFDKKDRDYLVSRYDAELAQADFNLSALFEKIKSLKLDKNSVIVFLSEHGDYLGENGYFMKPSPNALGNLHRANLNFPLIIKVPNLNNKVMQNQIVQTIDVAPTLLDFLELSPDKKMQGKSLKEVLFSQKEINDFSYGYSKRYDLANNDKFVGIFELETLQNKDWKINTEQEFREPLLLVEKPQFYLYNLKKDPEEKVNLADREPKVLAQLKAKLEEKRKHYSAL